MVLTTQIPVKALGIGCLINVNVFWEQMKFPEEIFRITDNIPDDTLGTILWDVYKVTILCYMCIAMGNVFGADNRVWDPIKVFSPSCDDRYAVIILNQPILLSPEVMLPIWNEADITMTVDGGTDRWIDYLKTNVDFDSSEFKPSIPMLIVGDLDSISSNNLERMKKNHVPIVKIQNQNLTDYSKALIQLSKECKIRRKHVDAVYVFVETAGRFDHIMGIINTLYKSHELIDHTETIINVASNSLTWLLKRGTHTIKIPEKLRNNNSWVGLIPFEQRPSCVSTTGLKWNLYNTALEFGGMVSTSNTYDGSPEVTVTTDTNIIWTMGIEPLVTTIKCS